MFNIFLHKYVTNVDSNCIKFLAILEFLAIFCTYVHIYKTTSEHEGNFRAERIVNSGA